MSTFQTAGGKTVATFREPKNCHIKIKFVPGGELPEELSGLFTTEKLADQAIKHYIEKSTPAEKKSKTKE